MKRQLLRAPMVIIALVTAVLATPKTLPATAATWTRWTTAGPGLNLNGKMFTLSSMGGGVSLYSPDYPRISTPWPSTTPYQTASTYPPWSTPTATRGVSVCMRYLIDQPSYTRIFTLSPSSSSPLLLSIDNFGYSLSFDRYGSYNVFLRPNIWFWSGIGTKFWTRVCFTVDSVKNVVQVFSGSNISIRKMLPKPYVWSGEPVIDFSGFDGQLTDVQVWNYPLRYTEVYNYMSNGAYGTYRGSVLTWSHISYSFTGYALLEDTFEQQAEQPISSRGRGRRPKGKKKIFNFWEMKEGKRQLK